ncbi:MAG: hypothetical protein JNJ78_18650 [Anaerolineae bacterium]|nr:hypothetical protein [Anaerolineae bacterium]
MPEADGGGSFPCAAYQPHTGSPPTGDHIGTPSAPPTSLIPAVFHRHAAAAAAANPSGKSLESTSVGLSLL